MNLPSLTYQSYQRAKKKGKLGNNEFQRVSKQIYDIYQKPIRTSQLSNHVRPRVHCQPVAGKQS